MSKDWVADINKMHAKFYVHEWMKNLTNESKFDEFIEFRLKFLQEELNEGMLAWEAGDPEEIVDAMIDLCVVAIGTLDAFGVDANKAWDDVHKANMSKEPGIKPERPNPLGLPDLVKPEGWKGPSHKGNHGLLETWSDNMLGRTV